MQGPVATAAILAIVAGSIAGVVLRPFRSAEAAWAAGGAALLAVSGLVPAGAAIRAVLRSGDVCLFLVGMMLLSEAARREGLFDRLASWAVRRARGSGARLFALVYAIGTLVTAFLSNDAAAVVLTPAVLAAARAAGTEPLPYLFACAMVANAASFALPISNPANLVLLGGRMPPLLAWLARFALPSALSIGATFVTLRLLDRRRLARPIGAGGGTGPIGAGARAAALGIGATAIVLLGASAFGLALGPPTFLCGAGTALAVLAAAGGGAASMLRGVSWSVLPLVAGLFVLVAGLERAGVVAALGGALRAAAHGHWAFLAAAGLALVTDLANNLPVGLAAGAAAARAPLPVPMVDGLMIGVDLGPNLSITGSLATILWLAALRRDGLDMSFGRFLARGAVAMPPALAAALAARALLG